VINIISVAGICGNFGQTNYSTAKMGLLGFTHSLAKEGEKRNIFVNAVAPLAVTAMSGGLKGKIAKILTVDWCPPVLLYLSSKRCKRNGTIYEICGGWCARIKFHRSKGIKYDYQLTAEDFERSLPEIDDMTDGVEPTECRDSVRTAFYANNERNARKLAMKKAHSEAKTKLAQYLWMLDGYLTLQEHRKQVLAVNAVFNFIMLDRQEKWVLDFVEGRISRGRSGKAAGEITVFSSDFMEVVNGNTTFLKLQQSVTFPNFSITNSHIQE